MQVHYRRRDRGRLRGELFSATPSAGSVSKRLGVAPWTWPGPEASHPSDTDPMPAVLVTIDEISAMPAGLTQPAT